MQEKSRVAVVVAGVGLVASIITIYAFVTGNASISAVIGEAGVPTALGHTADGPPASQAAPDDPTEAPPLGLRVVVKYKSGPKSVGLAYDAGQGRLFVASYGDGAVREFDAQTGELLDTVDVGERTSGLVYDPAGEMLHAASTGTGLVSEVAPSPLALGRSAQAVEGRATIVEDFDSKRIYVLNQTRMAVIVIDAGTYEVISELPLGVVPRSLMFDPEAKRLFVVSQQSSQLLVVNPATLTVDGRVSVPDGPVSVAVDNSHHLLLVVAEGSEELVVLDKASLKEDRRYPVGDNALAVAVDPGLARAYVTNQDQDALVVVDLASRALMGKVPSVCDSPQLVIADPSMHDVFVSCWRSGLVVRLRWS